MKLLLLLLLPIAAACSSHPSRSECERIADHMIDIFTAPRVAEDAKPVREVEQAVEAWRRNLRDKDPTRTNLIDVCVAEIGTGAVSCIMEAQDDVALARCFGS